MRSLRWWLTAWLVAALAAWYVGLTLATPLAACAAPRGNSADNNPVLATRRTMTMKHAEKPRTVRQGDVLVLPAPEHAARGAEMPRERGMVVLAHGEVTGHAHAVADPDAATQFLSPEWEASSVLDVTAETVVVHEEHLPVPLTRGTYEVRRAAEWTDADEPRVVAD